MKQSIIAAGLFLAVAIGISLSCFAVIRINSNRLFLENVEALSQCESHWGQCEEKENECIGKCSVCGALIYAAGHKGPAFGLSGHCEL